MFSWSFAIAAPQEKTREPRKKACQPRRRNEMMETNMVSRPLMPETLNSTVDVETSTAPVPLRHRMSTRNRLLFFLVAWLIVLMPFLFWWSTWFGRRLSDPQITEYLNDDKHPRHIQHALVQLGERMARQDAGAARWYPQLLRLASHPVEEVRNTDAWAMRPDTSAAAFHEALPKMLQESSPMLRGNAALSLVRFGAAAQKSPIAWVSRPSSLKRTSRPAPQNSHGRKSGSPTLRLSWWFGLLLLLGWLRLLLGLRRRRLWFTARLACRIQIFLRIVLLQDHYADALRLKRLQVFALVGWLCVLKVYGIDVVIFCSRSYRYTNEGGK